MVKTYELRGRLGMLEDAIALAVRALNDADDKRFIEALSLSHIWIGAITKEFGQPTCGAGADDVPGRKNGNRARGSISKLAPSKRRKSKPR